MITININGEEYEMEAARELYRQLHEIFGEKTYPPYIWKETSKKAPDTDPYTITSPITATW